MTHSLDDLMDIFPAPSGNLDHVEMRVLEEIAAVRAARSRLKGLVGTNFSVALAALVVGTAVGAVQSFHAAPIRADRGVSLVLTDIPGSALVD
ncbi:MAG: hypothetical protein V4527_03430 [Pseudomonadota bacterium]